MKWAMVPLLTVALVGCGGTVKVTGTLGTGTTTTAAGLVSFVNLTFVSDPNGNMINVTVVTLAQPGTAQTVTFCGSQSNLFPMNQTVRATFVPGMSCASIVAVVRM